MTIAANPSLGHDFIGDRRESALGPRRSWASTQPFLVRATAENGGAQHAATWKRLSHDYRARLVIIDIALGAVVTSLMLAPQRAAGEALTLGAVAGLGLAFLVAAARGYEIKELGDGPGEYQSLLRAIGVAAVLLMAVSFLLSVEVPRTLVLLGLPMLLLLGTGARYVHRRVLHRARERGTAMLRTLVVGDLSDVERVVTDLRAAPYHGYDVTGVCLPDVHSPGDGLTAPVVGAVADVPQVVVDRAVDVVVVAGSRLSGEGLRRLSWALDRAGAQMIVVPDLVEVTGPRLTVRPTAGLSLLEVEVGASRGRMLLKAVLDRVMGALLTVLAAPVVALAALAVRATSAGPAFYSQTRVGVDGATFTMWKLRSMYVDADERRAELAEQDEGAGLLFKLRHDPRVTPVGRFLRRWSLDELPQLLNVVKGDMSLVGPRPPLLSEVEEYPDPVRRRLRVRPGLTGLWQVSGRSDLSWDESVRLDLRYVDNWSVAMDLMILWKTLRADFMGSGAY